MVRFKNSLIFSYRVISIHFHKRIKNEYDIIDDYIFLYFGRIVKHKGIFLLLGSFFSFPNFLYCDFLKKKCISRVHQFHQLNFLMHFRHLFALITPKTVIIKKFACPSVRPYMSLPLFK